MINRILKTYHFKTMLGHTVIDTYSGVPKVVSAWNGYYPVFIVNNQSPEVFKPEESAPDKPFFGIGAFSTAH